MAHLRKQIRERIGTTLNGLTTTGSNVFQSRVYNVQTSELPALIIYTKDETSVPETMGATRTIFRELQVTIEAFAQATSNTDDTMDLIAKEIEVAMSGDITVNSLALDSWLSESEIEYSGEGKQPLAVGRFTYTVQYRNAENDPETAL